MTDVVIQEHSRKLLMMDILMSETCWAHKKWNKIASDIKLVFHSSTSTFLCLFILHLIYVFMFVLCCLRHFMLMPCCTSSIPYAYVTPHHLHFYMIPEFQFYKQHDFRHKILAHNRCETCIRCMHQAHALKYTVSNPTHSSYLLTPWSRVLLEKLASLQLVKKFPAFYGTRRFLTALTSAIHMSVS